MKREDKFFFYGILAVILIGMCAGVISEVMDSKRKEMLRMGTTPAIHECPSKDRIEMLEWKMDQVIERIGKK